MDGSGLGEGERVVTLSVLTGPGLVPLVWEYRTGDASEKGKEAAITRKLVERVRKSGGSPAITLLLADAFSADGPFLAWLKGTGTDAVVRLPQHVDAITSPVPRPLFCGQLLPRHYLQIPGGCRSVS